MASTATETSPLLPAVTTTTTAPSALSHAPGSASGSSTASEHRPKPPRNVTFNPNPVSKTIDPEPAYERPRTSHHHHHAPPAPLSPSALSTGGLGGGPIAALNSKLRRRNSYGSVPTLGGAITTGALIGGGGAGSSAPGGPKIGPQRSSKNAQKLKLLPNPELEDGSEAGAGDEESGRDVYSQYARIKDPTARRDAKRLGKADRDRLPRVTAYCTANKYQMEGLMRFLKGRGRGSRGANPKLIDECIYTPYSYGTKQAEVATLRQQLQRQQEQRQQQLQERMAASYERRHSTGELTGSGAGGKEQEDLIDIGNDGPSSDLGNGFPHHGASDLGGHDHGDESAVAEDFDTQVHTPEVFLFEYGVVVIWGMTESQEQRFLKEIAKFEMEKLAPDDVEAEYFNFYYTREYQARIYNDFITLRDKNNYMTKLAISHALAQSVKTSLFEELIASTIDTCKDIPTQIALTGKIALSRTQINMQIGELFILRINIHLNGSVLDTPELFWVEPQLEPVYQAVRSYLEMDQRVGLLTERLDVIADLLAVLKDQLSHGHGEKLEWIVIILIAAEILVAAVNIVVDLYAGID